MHLAHFHPVHPQPGGVAAAISGLVEAARTRGADDCVVSYGTGDQRARSTLHGPISGALLWSPLPIPVRHDPVARWLADRPELDAILLHGVFTPSCARLSARVPAVHPDLATVALPYDAYDSGLFGTRTAAKRAYWALVERNHLNRCDLVVVSAPSHREILEAAGVRSPVVVAAPGLSASVRSRAGCVALARAARRDDARAAERPLRLLVAGRWDIYEKGLDVLCGALADPALRRRVSVRLIGPEYGSRREVEALLRAYGLTTVEPVGYVDDIWTELLEADALVMPSRKEGFGIAALEALATGLPVLLSSRAGIKEHIDSGVVLADPTAGAMRAGIHELIERHAELSRTAAAQAPTLGRRHTWDRVLDVVASALNAPGKLVATPAESVAPAAGC